MGNQAIFVTDLFLPADAQQFRLLLLCAKASSCSASVIRALDAFDEFMTGKVSLSVGLQPRQDRLTAVNDSDRSACVAFLSEAAWFLRQLGGSVTTLAPWVDALTEKERAVEQTVSIEDIGLNCSKISRNIQTITLVGAQKLAYFAELRSREIGIPMSIAVVDVSCNLVLHQRMEDALQTSVRVALDKAYSAASFKIPTYKLGEMLQPGASLYGIQSNDSKLVAFGGGYPIWLDEALLGGFGVAGGEVEQDMDVACYALKQAFSVTG